MTKEEDKRLGMQREITRRDFLEGSLQLATGVAIANSMPAGANPGSTVGMAARPSINPSAGLGLRGSHIGSFEVAHQLAWEGRSDWGDVASDDEIRYDLVVVGAGVSGLSAAYFYKEQHPDANILILDNHDDFGGHAKRNEFSWGNRTILGYGGSQSLEAPGAYSDVARSLLEKLAVDIDGLGARYDQDFYRKHDLGSVIYFDKESYGRDVAVRSRFLDASLFMPLAESDISPLEAVDQMPLSEEGKKQLKALMTNSEDRLPDHSIFSEPGFLSSLSYESFIRDYLGVSAPEVISLLKNAGNSYFGFGTDMIPALDSLAFGLPGIGSTSLGNLEGLIRKAIQWSAEPYIYHFPDGNASVARLLVRSLIPSVAGGSTMDDVVTEPFNYSNLDSEHERVNLRLSSTVIRVEHQGRPGNSDVEVTYVKHGNAHRVKTAQVVLACYNMAIPHICPSIPARQKEALAKLVKVPMCSTNVLLRNWHAIKKVGAGLVYSPGRWNKTFLVEFPVSMGDYQFAATPDDPIMMHCLRGVTGTGTTPEEQSRNGRYELLAREFTDYEREIRQHLEGLLSPTGFDPARDIIGLTVNRWPHGYAWNPNPLFDPEYAEGEKPHEVGRQRFGNIAIANSDAGARAYLDCAIDEAWRAVQDLS